MERGKNMEINELTFALNEYAKTYRGEPEKIKEEDYLKALYYISNLYIKDELDALVFLLAMNLCNAYAKQADNHDVYRFKKDINTFVDIINKQKIANLKACMTNDKGNLYIFEIANIQITFHDEKETAINEFYQKDMTWDAIKKQPCASKLFNMCLSYMKTNYQITMTGKPIKILANKLIDDYHKKILTLEDILENI